MRPPPKYQRKAAMLNSIDVSTLVNKSLMSIQLDKFESPTSKNGKREKYKAPPGMETDEPDILHDNADEYLMKLNNELNLNETLMMKLKD